MRKAVAEDAHDIQQLIMFYAKRDEMLPRSLNEIYENIRDFSVIEKDGEIVACGALHVCWENLAEVKSLAVYPDYSKNGYGSKLVKKALREAKKLGVNRVFTLTFQAGFFEKLGFYLVDVNDLPKKVWYECIRCVHFPDCDEEALVKDI